MADKPDMSKISEFDKANLHKADTVEKQSMPTVEREWRI